jgi:transglutaminase-like putative cysteine protease
MPRVMLLAGLIGSVLAPKITSAQSSAADSSLAAIAQRVAGHAGTPSDRTRRLVTWIGSNLEWTWTDYQQRTPEQIVRRRAGNCADLAAVLAEMVKAAGVQSRWVAEINVQPRSEDRQARAVEKIKELGPRASVFGLEHNDHRWLEIYDSAQGGWVPADPAVGVVGVHDWEVSRLGFGKRPQPPVPAVAEITKDMLVPFMVTTIDGQHGPATTDRSVHYLIEEFDRAYGGRLRSLPSWPRWTSEVRQLSAFGRAAYDGGANLHTHEQGIDQLKTTYEQLATEATASGIVADR